jgi:hypothetical protein
MHLHYSPFQHATSVEYSTEHVNQGKVAKTLEGLTKADRMASKDMGCVMSVEQAARIPGTPTAFISPNPIGVMKDIKMPIAPIILPGKPEAAPALDTSYRTRMRTGYGDRGIDKMKNSGY